MAADYLSDLARAYLSRTPTVQPVATSVRLASEVAEAKTDEGPIPKDRETVSGVEETIPAPNDSDTTEPVSPAYPMNKGNQPAHSLTPEEVAARARALEFEHKTALARTIKSRMAELGMNQNQLSAATGIGVGQVSLILNAKQNITLRTLARIEAALGVRFDSGFVFGR